MKILPISGMRHARSRGASVALELVQALQGRFVDGLEALSLPGGDERFAALEWLRDEGRHGGGRRYAQAQSALFNRASVNVSSVHYDDMPEKRLGSATALSAIIHPQHPRTPSMHMHISWTEMRDGTGYWRLMADLNPSIENPIHVAELESVVREAVGERYEEGRAQGDRYFYIPALKRHRGAWHFYLEGYASGDRGADLELARVFGEAVIDSYAGILATVLSQAAAPTEVDLERQLAYHSVYLLQVLTLDRGTTSGLLVHRQNDVGILASLPSFVDRELLASWISEMDAPQDELLTQIVATLPDESPCAVTDEVRQALANVVREHYQAHPEALALQASGGVIPATVENHLGKR